MNEVTAWERIHWDDKNLSGFYFFLLQLLLTKQYIKEVKSETPKIKDLYFPKGRVILPRIIKNLGGLDVWGSMYMSIYYVRLIFAPTSE